MRRRCRCEDVVQVAPIETARRGSTRWLCLIPVRAKRDSGNGGVREQPRVKILEVGMQRRLRWRFSGIAADCVGHHHVRVHSQRFTYSSDDAAGTNEEPKESSEAQESNWR